MNWKEVDVPALQNILSTGEAQPLPIEDWPTWAQEASSHFTEAWLYPVLSPRATSTSSLSTEQIHSYVDIERHSPVPPSLRYYRYLYVKMADNRVFQSEPIKDVEYGHHLEERPSWLRSYRSESTG